MNSIVILIFVLGIISFVVSFYVWPLRIFPDDSCDMQNRICCFNRYLRKTTWVAGLVVGLGTGMLLVCLGTAGWMVLLAAVGSVVIAAGLSVVIAFRDRSPYSKR